MRPTCRSSNAALQLKPTASSKILRNMLLHSCLQFDNHFQRGTSALGHAYSKTTAETQTPQLREGVGQTVATTLHVFECPFEGHPALGDISFPRP